MSKQKKQDKILGETKSLKGQKIKNAVWGFAKLFLAVLNVVGAFASIYGIVYSVIGRQRDLMVLIVKYF